MVTIKAKGSAYGVKHFVLDSKEDFQLLRKDLLYMGSTAYVIATGETYIVNGKHEWVLKSVTNSSAGGSGGGSGDGDSDGDGVIDTIIYDGGEVLG